MKSKFWILLFAVLAVLCLGLSLWLLLPGGEASSVEVWSEGKLLYTLPLGVDTELTVTTDRLDEPYRTGIGNWMSMAEAGDYKGILIDTAERSYTEKYL